MKKIITFLSIALITLSSKAQEVFTEGFETGIPTTFTLLNEDGNTPTANLINIFQNKAWIGGFNFSGQQEVWAGSTSSYDPAGTADDWLITPAINITSSNYLYWSARSGNSNDADGYEVRISTTGKNIADFDSILFSIAAENSFWTDRYVDLSGYDGETVYIAFRNNSYDKYILAVDYITVKETYNVDAALTDLNIDELYTDGNEIQVKGTITNEGLDKITSVDVNWSTDGGSTVNTHSLSGLNIAALGGTYSFTHSDLITASNPGNYISLDVWLSNPNSTTDMFIGNDSNSMDIFVNTGEVMSRRVLLEEFTTAVCQYCPDGAVVVDEIVDADPSVIPVGLHACFGTDAMTTPEASAYCAAFSNAAPTATIDRVLFEGQTQVGISRSIWKAKTQEQKALHSPLAVDIRGSYNNSTRQVDVTINSTFVDYPLPGPMALTLFVIEDSVTGTGVGYDQINAYYFDSKHKYYQKGSKFYYSNGSPYYAIVGYPHRHVLRDVYPLNNAWGDISVFPSSGIKPNDEFSKSYSFTLNNNWDENQVYLVAFVSYYDMDDVSNREVLNAQQVHLQDMFGVGMEESVNVGDLSVSPNPFKGQSNLDFTLAKAENVKWELMDMTGKLISTKDLGTLNAGEHREVIQAGELESGFYMLRMTIGEKSSIQKISILK